MKPEPNEYFKVMRTETSDVKIKLWQAIHKDDYQSFKKLIDEGVLSDINEYRFGITLLHALVLRDGCCGISEEICNSRVQMAEILMSLGANAYAPAKDGAPWPIDAGQTPLQMAELSERLPFYYGKSMRESLAYTGENVLPTIKRHLGILPKKPSMLFQFGRTCAEHPDAFIGICAMTVLGGLYLKSGGKLDDLPKKVDRCRKSLRIF